MDGRGGGIGVFEGIDHAARMDFARGRVAALRYAAVPNSLHASQRDRDRNDDVDRRKPVYVGTGQASALQVQRGRA